MNKIDWSKFLSREFLVAVAVIAMAFVGLMYEKLTGSEFAIIASTAAGIFTGGITWQKRGAMGVNQEIVKQTRGRGLQGPAGD